MQLSSRMVGRGTRGKIDDEEERRTTYHDKMFLIEKVGAVPWVQF